MSRALARPAMQRRAASLARAHAASTQGSAPHGDQVSIDPSATAGSSSCVAQNFDHSFRPNWDATGSGNYELNAISTAFITIS